MRAHPTVRPRAALLLLPLCLLVSAPVHGLEWFDGRLALHGYWSTQIRALADDFQSHDAYLSQWANTLNLEFEFDLAPEGIGPFELVSGFARVEVRYECVFTGCAVSDSYRHFGDRATRAPARNWADGRTSAFVGDLRLKEREPIQGGTALQTITASPLLAPLFDLGAANVDATLEPVLDDLFTFKAADGTREQDALQLGPWRPGKDIRPIGALRGVPSVTLPLPMRPAVPDGAATLADAQGLYVPSAPLRERLADFDSFDQDFSEAELAWNHGAGQDEHELKELYLDLEALDARLWLRIGKQNIVWGKTELFRTTDQFNPQDLGLSSLPSLEESRLALWAVRAVYSFYSVGPLEDVRLEVAANFDDFEPVDLGRCGEPYTVWLVCGKSTGLWAHGVTGLGLAGEVKPPDPWDSWKGLEVGARLEFRWDRFSFALTDFWGYSDGPALEAFHYYERRVDPATGRPLDVRGEALRPQDALAFGPTNRQLFDLFCSATLGVAAALLPELGDSCVPDVLNANAAIPLAGPLTVTPAEAIAAVLGGGFGGEAVAEFFQTGGFLPTADRLVELVRDPADGPDSGFFALFSSSLSGYLSREQEALLGCGPFYGTSCDTDGVDLLNAEASVLIQSFPFVEEDMPVATRFLNGRVVILPGARGPGDPGYDRRVDGTPPPGFRSEMAALSANFARLLAILGSQTGTDPDCSLDDLVACDLLRAVVGVTGVQRPDARAGGNGRYGRRDFLWASGGEALLRYPKRNVLGFSMDFAEDRTKSNWSFELTWIDDATLGSTTSRSQLQEGDAWNLTISVDRPTFVNFLNANRTFFFNAQLFLSYLPGHDDSYTVQGPVSALATLAVATGYYQDRLLPSLVLVYDVRSASGGVLPLITYRFNQDFSVTVGAPFFFGRPETSDIPLHQLALDNNGGDFRRRRNYAGLSPIAERDEVFLILRYTF